MKVIAIIEPGTLGKYMCEVNHKEIEKYRNLYYGDMSCLKTGDKIDLGKGYDWHQDTVQALEQIKGFLKSHQKIITAITTGLLFAAGEEDGKGNSTN